MNRIAVFLRNAAPNKFRSAILNTLRLPEVDSGLLCSGFFQSDARFTAGADFDLVQHRPCRPITLTPLGLYSYTWKSQFAGFLNALRAANPCQCVTIAPKRIPGMRWHAKVFIAKKGPEPAVAIVGSSNITRRAFGAFSDFNRECDVVMWNEVDKAVDRAVEDAIGADGDAVADIDSGAIVATYDRLHRANRRPLGDRVLALENEIMHTAVDW